MAPTAVTKQVYKKALIPLWNCSATRSAERATSISSAWRRVSQRVRLSASSEESAETARSFVSASVILTCRSASRRNSSSPEFAALCTHAWTSAERAFSFKSASCITICTFSSSRSWRRSAITAVALSKSDVAWFIVSFRLAGIDDSRAVPPVDLNPRVIDVLRGEIERRALPVVELASGAGHDAGVLARAGVATGMLFVRSLAGGVSHSPDELSSAEDIELAIDVLAAALSRL